MGGKAVAVCIVVGILGLISAAVGLVFEAFPDRILVKLFYFSVNCIGEGCVECEYFRSPAFFLVVVAIICVFVAQIVISVAADCGCCATIYSSPGLQFIAILSFFFSWLGCIVAIILYAVGGAKQYGVQFPEIGHLFSSDYWNNSSLDTTFCYKVKHGIFAGACVSSFGAVFLGILSYLAYVCGRRRRIQARENHSIDDIYRRNDDNAPGPTDIPIAIPVALPVRDYPTRPVRDPIVEHNTRVRAQPARVPVMVEA